MMRTLAHTLFLFAFFSLVVMGCSSEEQAPPPKQQPKVVKRIKKPAPKKTAPVPMEKETAEKIEEEKIQPTKRALPEPKVEKPSEILAPEPKPAPAPVEEDIKTSETPPPQPLAPEPTLPEPPKTVMIETKEEAPPAEKPPETKPALQEEVEGYYIVKEGDSLAGISGREIVYGDPLKWPVLYRYNLEKFADMPEGDDLPDRMLPTGLKLKILTPDKIAENLQKRPNHYWVINILSDPANEKIVPAAIKLVKNGYPIYITKANVKGKDWMRLRLGFFETRKEAETEGSKIMDMMNFRDTWNTKIRERELKEFGGF